MTTMVSANLSCAPRAKPLSIVVVDDMPEIQELVSHWLSALGCDLAQGYLVARPQHPDAIAALLQRVPVST